MPSVPVRSPISSDRSVAHEFKLIHTYLTVDTTKQSRDNATHVRACVRVCVSVCVNLKPFTLRL